MKFLELDSPFHRFMSSVADMMLLGLLWFFLSIFIIPLGAATTALFYVSTKRHTGKSSYIWREFWRSFAQNFIKATIINIIFLGLFLLLFFNMLNMGLFEGNLATTIIVFQLFMVIQLLFIMVYIYPLLARFNLKFSEYFKTAFFLANRHLLTTLMCVASLAGLVFLSWFAFLPFILVLMGFYANVSSALMIKIFRKHRPDFDASEEDEENLEKTSKNS